jgi:hypothetical protein
MNNNSFVWHAMEDEKGQLTEFPGASTVPVTRSKATPQPTGEGHFNRA